MKRTKFNYEIRLTDALVDKFLGYPNYPNVLALYVFYRRVGMRQHTDQPYATNEYCRKALHCGSEKFYEAKKVLTKMKLIEQVRVGATLSKFGKPYIRLIPVVESVARTNRLQTPRANANPQCPHEFQTGRDFAGHRRACAECELRDVCTPWEGGKK